MNIKQIKQMIEMPNNSAFIDWERRRGLNSLKSAVYIFSATPFAASSVEADFKAHYAYNEVVMKIVEKHSYGNTYEIYIKKGQ